jgi:hypothetical protein
MPEIFNYIRVGENSVPIQTPTTYESRIVELTCKCGNIMRHTEDWWPPEMLKIHYNPRCPICEHEYIEKLKAEDHRLLIVTRWWIIGTIIFVLITTPIFNHYAIKWGWLHSAPISQEK